MGQTPGENTHRQIEEALCLGFDVEIDVSWYNGKFYLGHDFPNEDLEITDLQKWSKINQIFVHCKTIRTVQSLCANVITSTILGIDLGNVIPFYHQEDPCILLMNGQVWVHPNNMLYAMDYNTMNTIFVLPSMTDFNPNTPYNTLKDCWAICTDWPAVLKKDLERYTK